MLIGIIRADSTLQKTEEVLREAYEKGEVDGYPYLFLVRMLAPYEAKIPTASGVAGGAWRQLVIAQKVPHYGRLDDMMAMFRGTLVHAGVEAIKSDRPVMREKRLYAQLPTFTEVKVSGQIDSYFPHIQTLEDLKTTQRIPEGINEEHQFQLAVYKWLLEWNGYPVKDAAIVYMSWYGVNRVRETPDGVLVIETELFTNEEYFESQYYTGWKVIERGYNENIVPSYKHCNQNWCRRCPVKWVCDRLPEKATQVLSFAEFNQEEYYDVHTTVNKEVEELAKLGE